MEKPRLQPERLWRSNADSDRADDGSIHPAWRAFIRYCSDLGHGELEKLSIQDGLPILAEHVRQKVKFKA